METTTTPHPFKVRLGLGGAGHSHVARRDGDRFVLACSPLPMEARVLSVGGGPSCGNCIDRLVSGEASHG